MSSLSYTVRGILAVAIIFVSAPLACAVDFTNTRALNTNATTDSGDDSFPKAATDGDGHWVVVWQSNDTLGATIGADLDILVSRSSDNGSTWSDPEPLNASAESDSGDDTVPVISTDKAGNWICIWRSTTALGLNDTIDADLFYSISTDNGVNWSAVAALNSTYETDGAATDDNPALATDLAGNWVCVWESTNDIGATIGTDSDILVARSTNNGGTWSAPASVKTNAATDGTFADTRPCIVAGKDARLVTAWQSDDTVNGTISAEGNILFAYSDNHGATWTGPTLLNVNTFVGDNGPDENISLAADPATGRFIAAWNGYRFFSGVPTNVDMFFAWTPSNGVGWSFFTNVTQGSTGGDDARPFTATDGKSTWLALWDKTAQQGTHTDADIFKIESFKLTSLTYTIPLNTNFDKDKGNDYNINAANDGSGNWVFVWDSNDKLKNTVGPDRDIFVATRKPATKDDINITRPQATTTWHLDTKESVRWSPTYNSGPFVGIDLMRNGVVVRNMKPFLQNKGSSRWKIPTDIPPANNYKVRVRSTTYPEAYADSKPFTIAP